MKNRNRWENNFLCLLFCDFYQDLYHVFLSPVYSYQIRLLRLYFLYIVESLLLTTNRNRTAPLCINSTWTEEGIR